MTPLQCYRKHCRQNDFVVDMVQQMAVMKLQHCYEQLVDQQQHSKNILTRWSRLVIASNDCVKGFYIWGGVGRGKTYLMDLFYQCLPFENKLRLHFHHLMQRIHDELECLKGSKNPLDTVALKLSRQACVLCLDEFFVSDIGDAMLLGTLLNTLFKRGVTLVATSNIEPQKLYLDGLQRQRFLPAIELLQQHCEVINLHGDSDYRLRTLRTIQCYYFQADAEQQLQSDFKRLAQRQMIQADVVLNIQGRPLQALQLAGDIVWFDFYQLCDGPRSQNDYIELAQLFNTIIISNVTQFRDNDAMARRFINLIDELYDWRVNVILAATVAMSELYSSGRLHFEFERTCSRLQEMQSVDYLGQLRVV